MSNDSPDSLHRLPNSRFTRLAISLGRLLFWRRKVYGKENIDLSKPCVFTCNHGRTSGPASAVIHLPVRFKPWINACMLNREEATATMMRTFRDKFTFLGNGIKRRLLYAASGVICHFLNSFEPIPVFKGKSKESLETIHQSVDALAQGYNLLIFPEKPGDRYDEHSYKEFNTGFAALGKAYFERTGERLDFYPIWSDGKSHSFRIGKPVSFDPANEDRAEKVRISSELKERMIALKDS